MNPFTVMLLGATGLVGSHTLDLLTNDDRFSRIHVPTRRPLSSGNGPKKVDVRIVDFDHPESLRPLAKVDVAICALGTTIKKAGSRENFRKVDYEYCMEAARQVRNAGATRFLVVTSMGSSPRSPLFYSRVKGDLEESLKGMEFSYLGIFRPSFLAGDRAEHRPGEALGIKFGALMPKKYKPIHARAVAGAMIEAAAGMTTGVEVIESDQLQDFAAAHPYF